MHSLKKVLVLNGPNLNLLGEREPQVYGTATYDELKKQLEREAQLLLLELECFQSNHEGALIDKVHQARAQVEGIIINPGGFTHTSVALRDALLAVDIPFIEVHLSNIAAREPFRRHSYLSDKAAGVIFGFGTLGYSMAITAIAQCLRDSA